MENKLQIFNYGVKEIRTITKDGEPWFVAKDVAEILGYECPEKMYSRIEDEDRQTLETTPVRQNGRGGYLPPQRMVYINEPGVYEAIFGSILPEAKNFKRWITHEVIPSIRKTGQYSANGRNEFKKMELEVKVTNSRVRQAREIMKIASKTKDEYLNNQLIQKAAGIICGETNENIKLAPVVTGDELTNDLINFRTWLEAHPLNSTAQLLYTVLLEMKYSFGYKGWFKVSNNTLSSKMSVADNTLDAARKKLIENGIIEYKSDGDRRQPGKYLLKFGTV